MRIRKKKLFFTARGSRAAGHSGAALRKTSGDGNAAHVGGLQPARRHAERWQLDTDRVECPLGICERSSVNDEATQARTPRSLHRIKLRFGSESRVTLGAPP